MASTICYRDARGVRHCDHVHAEDLPINGGGFHSEVGAEPEPAWNAQNNSRHCSLCGVIVFNTEYEGHLREHYDEEVLQDGGS